MERLGGFFDRGRNSSWRGKMRPVDETWKNILSTKMEDYGEEKLIRAVCCYFEIIRVE